MSSYDQQLYCTLQLNCHSLQELDDYVRQYGLDVNQPAVVARRNELTESSIISDNDWKSIVEVFYDTVEDLDKAVEANGLDRNDPVVVARRAELLVSYS